MTPWSSRSRVRELGGPHDLPGNPGNAILLHLDQAVGTRSLQDGGLWPRAYPRDRRPSSGHALADAYPSNWHMPMDCMGEGEGPGSFKAASMSATYDVYLRCAAGRLAPANQ